MSRETSPYIVGLGPDACVTHTGKMVPIGDGEFVEQIIVTFPGEIGRVPDRLTRPTPATAMIYFIGPRGGPIKIGWASRVQTRLRDLRLANAFPLEIWATVEGPPSLEREYHKRFAAYRLHGEWFERSPSIEAEIERLGGGE